MSLFSYRSAREALHDGPFLFIAETQAPAAEREG